MSRYLVTGGAGFIGSHLSERLLRDGHEVLVLDNFSTGVMANLEAIVHHASFELVHGSVLDETAVDELAHRADVVVHLAAAVGVKLILAQPLRSMKTNVRGFETVVEAAHRYRRPILLASTSEVYGKNSQVPLHEDSDRLLGGPDVARWAYSAAKGLDEALAYAYHAERDLPIVVTRLFNTVGPRQSPAYGMVIPRLVRQALAGEPITIYGNGQQTRCFCHVLDTVEALVGLLNRIDDANGKVFNVGSTEEISISDLADRIRGRSGSSSELRLVSYDDAYESGFEDMLRRVPDTTRLRELTGWRPTRSLNEILDSVIAEVEASG